MKPHSEALLLISLVLFVLSAIVETGHGFLRADGTGVWTWGNWIFGWAMVFFAASFYF